MAQSTWPLEQIRQLDFRMSLAYQGNVPKPGNWYGLHNELCVVWLLEQGRVRLETAKGNRELIPGSWIFKMPGLQLNQIFTEDARLISLSFHMCWPNGRSLFRSDLIGVGEEGHYPIFRKAALQLIKRLPRRNSTDEANQLYMEPDQAWEYGAIEQAFLQQWYRCALDFGYEPQAPDLNDKRVSEAVSILQTRLDQRDVPYDELRYELNLSRAQLDRLFQQELNHSPKHEHDSLRLAFAQEQLLQTMRPIKQIAHDLGFSDASQFAKWYRRLDGRNPRQARQTGLISV